MALETNSERSGASSAQSGSETRGARNRFSQSGAAAASVVMSPSNPIARPAPNGIRNGCGTGYGTDTERMRERKGIRKGMRNGIGTAVAGARFLSFR
ncbi:hypothetical protein GCM10010221_26160 [Streptomyces parvus]|nr:hypothetical protein GCM10010221_26160 [Streptomyces parvus]